MLIYEKPKRIELIDNELTVDGKKHPRDVRKLSKLQEVLKGYPNLDAGDPDMYYMFRKVHKKKGIRFDITVIPSGVVEGECAKTYGHAHPEAQEGLTYPEVYQVLGGSAVFLLQKQNRDRSVTVVLLKARKGDVLLIPPNYAHITINPGKEMLVLSNLVADEFESDYADFKKYRGAAFYYSAEGNVEQNANYVVKDVGRPKVADFNQKYGFSAGDLLAELESNPQKFAFLNKPSLLKR
jgi:glucose-6-phosphate isomerase